MEKFDGYLFAKLQFIHSFSEGPLYVVQLFDHREIVVLKKTEPWEPDPLLDSFLNKKVTIEGHYSRNGIEYTEITEYRPGPPSRSSAEPPLEVNLELSEAVVMVNKMPPGPNPRQALRLTLGTKWPARGIWKGRCPTTLTSDFSIEHGGETIWRWSADKAIAPVVTPVEFLGSSDFREFSAVAWTFKPESIESEGTYTARALFIAAGLEATADFEIKFIQ